MGLLAQPPPLSTPLPPSLEEPRNESDASLSFSNTASNLATPSPSRFQFRLHATPLCGGSLFLSRSDSARCSLPPATVLSQSRFQIRSVAGDSLFLPRSFHAFGSVFGGSIRSKGRATTRWRRDGCRRSGSREEAPGFLDTPKKSLIGRRLEVGMVVRAESKLVRCGGDNDDGSGWRRLV
ncbi:unnamed protein product [Linum trigynum]|uniref:Uncharacterized protein n=1 Tax=Linum trigynum TaxID=586398 RepID=A0AAV2E4C5_9ROSI